VRASTAAPTYFRPETITIGRKKPKQYDFVDGGVTMYNDPAFQMFLMATVDRYWAKAPPESKGWKTGPDRMLVVSVGTGTSPAVLGKLGRRQTSLLFNARSIPSALMFAALTEQDFLCRAFGECRAGDVIDREVCDMIGSVGPANPKLFSYVRYNAELTAEGLAALGCGDIPPKRVQQMDAISAVGDMRRVGQAVADKKVKPEHFAGFPA
jgi:uncharacterized protein